MEIVLCGRNVEIPHHFREHTAEKLARVERYDHKIIRMDVQLSHEPNPRQAKNCQRVEITGHGRGPVVRGEGCAADFYTALDQAAARLESRLRRAHDRRRVHRGRHAPVSVAQATADAGPDSSDGDGPLATLVREHDEDHAGGDESLRDNRIPSARGPESDGAEPPEGSAYAEDSEDPEDPEDSQHLPGRIVRRKEHHAAPMSVDDALSQMELVGHDFFLFSDAATGRPSVVYRRRGYDYGLIALA